MYNFSSDCFKDDWTLVEFFTGEKTNILRLNLTLFTVCTHSVLTMCNVFIICKNILYLFFYEHLSTCFWSYYYSWGAFLLLRGMMINRCCGFTVPTERIMWFLSVSAFLSTPHQLTHSPHQISSTLSPPVSNKATNKHLHLRQAPLLSPVSRRGQFL